MNKKWIAAVYAAAMMFAGTAFAHESDAIKTVGRAIEAMGGYKLANIRAVTIKGLGRHFELQQALSDVSLNPPLAKDLFDIPVAMRSGAQPPALHEVEYQWIFRRIMAGGLLDTNEIGFDPRMGGLRMEEIASGIQQVVGGNPNNRVVEMKDHVVVFDAPNNETHTAATRAVVKAK